MSSLAISPAAASADTSSTIANTSGKPYIGAGVWLTDQPSGLFTQIAMEGESFDIASYSPSKSSAKGTLTDFATNEKHCGYVETQYLDVDPDDKVGNDDPDNICQQELTSEAERTEYAKQINTCPTGEDGKCVTGVGKKVVRKCTVYRKFAAAAKDATNPEWPDTKESGPSKPIGEISPDTEFVNFRYTWANPDARGRFYSPIKSTEYGWVWVRRKCLKVSFTNSPEGGDPKTGEAEAGPKPYTGSVFSEKTVITGIKTSLKLTSAGN